jgi:uncharacterized membrane protein YbhN (UPF0104 family)
VAADRTDYGDEVFDRNRLLRGLRAALVAIVVAAAGFAISRQWSGVHTSLDELSALWTALAVAAVMGALFGSMLAWRYLLADLGSPLPISASVRIFFVGQLGKYLPGSVWPVVTQMELGRSYNVQRKQSATAGALTMAVVLVAGVVVAAMLLPFLAPRIVRDFWYALLIVPAGLVVVHPHVFTAFVNRVLRLARRQPLDRPLSWRGLGRAFAAAAASWLLLGVQVFAISRDLGAGGPRLLPLAIAGFALAWTTGFVVVFVPAGVGIREAVLYAVLVPAFDGRVPDPTHAAVTAALVSRFAMTVGDVAWGAIALMVSARRRSAEPLPDPPR